jgi:hypothetical protein
MNRALAILLVAAAGCAHRHHERQLLPWLASEETWSAGGLGISMGEPGGTDASHSEHQTLTWKDDSGVQHQLSGNNFRAHELAGGRTALITTLEEGLKSALYFVARSGGDARLLTSGIHRSWEVISPCDRSKFYLVVFERDPVATRVSELGPDGAELSALSLAPMQVIGARGHALMLVKRDGAHFEVVSVEGGQATSLESGGDWNERIRGGRTPVDAHCGESLAYWY